MKKSWWSIIKQFEFFFSQQFYWYLGQLFGAVGRAKKILLPSPFRMMDFQYPNTSLQRVLKHRRNFVPGSVISSSCALLHTVHRTEFQLRVSDCICRGPFLLPIWAQHPHDYPLDFSVISNGSVLSPDSCNIWTSSSSSWPSLNHHVHGRCHSQSSPSSPPPAEISWSFVVRLYCKWS